jgi:hypothetical protein
MPAKDFYHDHVKQALVNYGWTITREHLPAGWIETKVQIDLAAERLIVAEKGLQKIAVEIKNFLGVSELTDLYGALGQYILYRNALRNSEPDRVLYLALPEIAFNNIFLHPDGEALRTSEHIMLLVFKTNQPEVLQWIE